MNSFDFVDNEYRPLEDAMHDVREFHKAFNHPHPAKRAAAESVPGATVAK